MFRSLAPVMAALSLLPSPCTAQATGAKAPSVNRCTVDGQQVFQQAPCAGSLPRVGDEIRERAAAADRENARMLRERTELIENERRRLTSEEETKRRALDKEKEAKEEALFQQHCGGQYLDLKIGMTEEQVRHCTEWRYPKSVNITKTAAGVQKQYVFDRFGPSYLYFRNGILTAIQM